MNTPQYTIRNVPEDVTRVLKKRAKREDKSFNQTVVDALVAQTATSRKQKQDKADWLFGQNQLDEGFDEAIREQSKVDKELWR